MIVLGMDGMDAGMIRDWMDAGELPNFARLRDSGTFAPLQPGNPAQSPVSWATLNTGKNPGKHAIFDFIRVSRPAGLPVPGFGFQEVVKVPTADAGLPLASPTASSLLLGGGVVVGLILFLMLRRHLLVGLIAAAVFIGAGAYFGLGLKSAFPEEGFKDYESLAKAEPFWMELDRKGIGFRGQGTIVTYPVQEMENGKVVAGLGAPDATGSLNSWAIYTTQDERVRMRKTYKAAPAYDEHDAPTPKTRSGSGAGSGRVYRLVPKDGTSGVYESKLFGPLNEVRYEQVKAELEKVEEASKKDPAGNMQELRRLRDLRGNRDLLRTSVPMEVKWSPGQGSAEITVDGSTQTVALGSWSEFYEVTFPWSAWLSTKALARIWAETDGDSLELFAGPLQIDPREPTPGSRICWPRDFAAGVADRIGFFETLGWACQTHAVKDAELSDAAFFADIEFTYEWRRRMLEDALEDSDWKVLFHFFGSPDRVCHMMMRHIDPRHPQYDEALASAEYDFFGEKVAAKDSALAIYQKMDDTVGWLLERLGPDDTLLIVSDHGFDSFRKQVSINNWLAEEGFLAFKKTSSLGLPLASKDVNKGTLRYVDWANTQAYSIAIGKIYLNRQGREKYGTVSDADADRVLQEITDRLYELTDPDSGEKVVKKVYRREEIYDGDYWKESPSWKEGAPELTLDFVSGYRAAWTTTSGGIRLTDAENEDGEMQVANGPIIYDNTSPWSGDHCGVDMEVVQGIFFSNQPLGLPSGDDHYDATHLAPTVLDIMGVPVPADYDRQPLTPRS